MKYLLYVKLKDGRELSGVYGWAEALARFTFCLNGLPMQSFYLLEVA